MCGIAGYVGAEAPDRRRVDATLRLMRNRGPDRRRAVIDDDGVNHFALLHSRLAIIDLDRRSDQPFTIDDVTIIFNGEIYNYVELRRTLETQGVVFRTRSDTEVLLRGQCDRDRGMPELSTKGRG